MSTVPKNRRKKRKTAETSVQQRGLNLRTIRPLTEKQSEVFDSFYADKNIVMSGLAGTGKTFLALYLAIRDVMDKSMEDVDKVVIVRSAVQSREQGFLPGNIQSKASAYEDPYISICSELFNRGDAYGILKQKMELEFTTTSFIRGVTMKNAVVIIDEFQNMNFSELNTIMTRVGENSRLIFCGDYRQTDLSKPYDKSGFHDFCKILKKMESFDYIDFGIDDIVRSALVKEYIIAGTKTDIQT